MEKGDQDLSLQERKAISSDKFQRYLDHQIETERWLSELALSVLKLILSIIIISLTVISILIKAVTSGQITLNIVSTDIGKLSREMADIHPFVYQDFIAVILAISIFAAIILFIGSLLSIVLSVPTNAVQTLSFKRMNPGVDLNKITNGEFDNPSKEMKSEETTYLGILQSNQRKLEKTKGNWEQCYNQLWNGFRRFFISGIFLFGVFVTHNSASGYLSLFLLMTLPFRYLKNRVSYSDIDSYLFVRKEVDIPLLMVGFAFVLVPAYPEIISIPHKEGLIVVLILVFGPGLAWGASKLNETSLAALSIRTITLCCLLLILFFVHFLNPIVGAAFPQFMIALIMTSLGGTVVFLLFYVGKVGRRYVGNWRGEYND